MIRPKRENSYFVNHNRLINHLFTISDPALLLPV